MPPLGEAIDDPTNNDDYVAQLLTKDARDSSLKYSALGMQAYLPRRPTTGAPKPNTRFLKNILRDTDNHNAALKRKEEEEARERMRKLRAEKSSSNGSRRHDEDREREAKRRRITERDEKRDSRRSRHYGDLEDDDRSRRHRRRDSDSEDDHHRSSKKHRRRDDDDDRHRSRRYREHSKSPSRSSRYTREHDRSSHRRRHRRSSRSSASPSRSRSRSPESSRRRRHRERENRRSSRPRDDSLRRSPRPSAKTERRDKLEQEASVKQGHLSDNDSDPLDEIIGPLPASQEKVSTVRTRGRGAYRTNTSNIDAHFATNYDPTLDIQLDDDERDSATKSTRRPVAGLMTEEDDWDMALEALRDRAVWKKKGAERLREAGFGESVVERWTNNAAFSGLGDGEKEKSIEDFKWAKKGEGREWDRGKVLTEDGHVDVKAPW